MTHPQSSTVNLIQYGELLTSDSNFEIVFQHLDKVAKTDISVFLIGESGTGKELAAGAVHANSIKQTGTFVPVNCGAIPAELMESELFGHVKGSFTGAQRDHKGYFEQADAGTLFLDEITEMPINLQAKLLRVLESGEVRPVGSKQLLKPITRIIAATNREPEAAIREGFLREDLFYRLAQFPITLPPLRERAEDIHKLAKHFLAELNQQYDEQKSFSPQVLELFSLHSWPGNVRELRHALQRAHALADDIILPKHLPTSLQTENAEPIGELIEVRVGVPLRVAEKQLIEATLRHLDGDKKATATTLGISLKTLYNRLNHYQTAA